jgi:hypothetical protein
MLRLASLLTLLAIGTVGCVDFQDTAEPSLESTEQAVIDCDDWQCGSNSPIISTFRFHELNINGLPNLQGFSVMSLWKEGIHYQLSVENGRIIGRWGSLMIWGSALADAQIRVRQSGKTYAIRIRTVTTIQTVAKLGGVTRPIEAYVLDVSEIIGGAPPTEFRYLCSNIPSRDSPDLQGMNSYLSVVFEGERINAAEKRIATTLDTDWFNIGCAGHALAKMALNAQTEAAHQAWGFNTTILERQAFLKMVSGDYCGTGRAFTVAGQPLEWMDAHGYKEYKLDPLQLALEARWTANGATCLNTPRVNANPTPMGNAVFMGMVVNAINNECGGRPPCFGAVTFLDGKTWASANTP